MDFTNALPGKLTGGIEGFNSAEAAPEYSPIPPGVNSSRVLRGEYCSTKAGADADRLRFEVTDGEYKGRSLVRTWTFSEKAIAYTKRDLAPFGLTTMATLLLSFPDRGRDYLVKLVVAIQLGDDGMERNDIKRIELVRVEESPAAAFLLPGGSEGGPK